MAIPKIMVIVLPEGECLDAGFPIPIQEVLPHYSAHIQPPLGIEAEPDNRSFGLRLNQHLLQPGHITAIRTTVFVSIVFQPNIIRRV